MDNQISVLITFYNQEQYVDRAINSVMSQKTNFPFKVIIGDDGSSDGTINKILDWEEKYSERITHIVQPREKGKKYIGGSRASRNRLALLAEVDTPYFIYLDGDDYWTDDEKLQIQFDILEKQENSDCVGCAHIIDMFDEDHPKKITPIPRFINHERKYDLKEYWRNYYFHTDTILFRSSVKDKIRKDFLLDFFNDNLITYAFLQFGKIYFLPRTMAAYVQNQTGIWASEKKAVSVLRNILSYDIELKINHNMRRISNLRHVIDFKSYIDDKDSFTYISKDYFNLAEQYDCKMSVRALNGKNLLYKSTRKEKMYIFLIKIKHYSLVIKKICLRR